MEVRGPAEEARRDPDERDVKPKIVEMHDIRSHDRPEELARLECDGPALPTGAAETPDHDAIDAGASRQTAARDPGHIVIQRQDRDGVTAPDLFDRQIVDVSLGPAAEGIEAAHDVQDAVGLLPRWVAHARWRPVNGGYTSGLMAVTPTSTPSSHSMLADVAASPTPSLAWQRFAFGVAGFLVVWLPIQTTLIAALYQYAGIPATWARALLLGKDVIVAASVVLLAIAYRRFVRLRWFDFVAAAYVALVLLYAFVPMFTGSGLPVEAVAASIRAFVLPIELYALGRLVTIAGVSIERVVSLFVCVSAIAAVGMLLQYALTGPSFWVETIDLVGFVRDVQGLPGAVDLWSISALGHFGVGDVATFARAVGPFAHPVGTAHYFLLPLILSAAIGVTPVDRRPGWARRPVVVIALVILFALAVITPISRGAWIAAVVAAIVVGVLSGRLRRVALGLVIGTAFVALVPPFQLLDPVAPESLGFIGHRPP